MKESKSNQPNDKQFWNKMAQRYNQMFDNNKAYRLMYQFIREPLTKDMQVLEVGTGTGMIAREVSNRVQSVEATDFSEEMIDEAKQIEHSQSIQFACADIFDLPYEDNSFDTVIAANILHIISNPEKALKEISRVLKPEGIFIAPTFMWKQLNFWGRIQKFVMLRKNFPIQTKWDSKSYFDFITDNGFEITKSKIIKSSFSIACVECKKSK